MKKPNLTSQKTIISLVVITILTLGLIYISNNNPFVLCTSNETFKTDILLKTTPVKNQGKSSTCWIYSMLATIETDRIEQNDSLNLSPIYLERCLIKQKAIEAYFGHKPTKREMAEMAPQCIELLNEYGAIPYDSYHLLETINSNAIAAKAMHLAHKDAVNKKGLTVLNNDLNNFLDDQMGSLPLNVYMFGVEYTPLQFAHSLDYINKYKAYTSVSHHPFNYLVTLECPDNVSKHKFMNVTIDSLMTIIDVQLAKHNAVCWEGAISKKEFSFKKGIAKLNNEANNITQQMRQKAIENLETIDQHAMAIVGKAHNKKGETYYIAKNSWGTNNPFKGFVYMSKNFVKLRTMAITTKIE